MLVQPFLSRCGNGRVKSTHLWDRVVVDVDDLVQILGDNLSDFCQFLEVEGLVGKYIHGESDGRQVAHCNL